MTDQAPQRRRVTMPPVTEWPRVGKIRLGEKVAATSRTGSAIERPSAIDYFRVDGTDEVTSPESAASFHEVYGEQPRSIRCQIPGRSPDDVFEGAWRLYGARKLKVICDGETCDERTATGGWLSQPCLCKAQGIPLKKPNGTANDKHCKLNWTLNVILPDVAGVGVWQIDTSSDISIARVSRWLQMMANVAGDLMLLDFTLNLVPVSVTPDGRTKTVYVLEPRAVSSTPRELLTGGGRPAPALEAGTEPSPITPPPVYDEEPVDPEPVESGDIVDEGGDGGEQSEQGAAEPAMWRQVLESLHALAPHMSVEEIGAEVSRIMGRTVTAPELADPAIGRRAIDHFVEQAEKAAASDGDPGPEGQTSFLPPDEGEPLPYGEPG